MENGFFIVKLNVLSRLCYPMGLASNVQAHVGLCVSI